MPYHKSAKKELDKEKKASAHGKNIQPDDTTKEHYGKEPFSTGTRRNIEHTIAGHNVGEDKELHHDSRHQPLPEDMPKINIHQKRNDEHIKYDDSPESELNKT